MVMESVYFQGIWLQLEDIEDQTGSERVGHLTGQMLDRVCEELLEHEDCHDVLFREGELARVRSKITSIRQSIKNGQG